eukprot:CAMPEP_0204017642 /NCGR_PEP_ID=MMETSP0360-20130528/27538_1 /ASSEMBLY_ACC=CAM_ASM_000342 /TAXON_ID=268821 /ORGANISM="Scrippsiella Hangoei, Strain SHTV-5" /LENGTH=64 /DNA_ID=CAMNT_0050960709 /DNA_START=40 /DNA_END=232 /DNA_ORIENTATION=+
MTTRRGGLMRTAELQGHLLQPAVAEANDRMVSGLILIAAQERPGQQVSTTCRGRQFQVLQEVGR